MAFEPNYEKLVTSFRKTLTTSQSQVDVKLSTVDASEIKSILCSTAKANIVNAEVSNGTINYNGLVNFQVIYESTTGDIYGLDYTAEFVDKYSSDAINNVLVPVVTSSVVDINVNVLNNKTITATAIVENRVDGIVNESAAVLTNVNGNNIFTSMEESKFYTYVGTLLEKYDLQEDLLVNEGVSKVLSVNPTISLESVTPNNNFAVVKGNVFVDMCYLTNAENPKVCSKTQTFDFGFEVALNGVSDNTYVQSDIYINTNDIKVTSNLEMDKAVINLNIPISYSGYAFNSNTLNVVADVYSTTNELNLVSSSVNNIVPFETLTAMDKLNGSVMITDSFVDEILGNCCNYVGVTSSFIEDDFVVVEGVANTTVLYYSKEDDTKNSIMVEMPFSIKVKSGDLLNNANQVINVALTDIQTKSKRGQEIEVFAKLYLYIDVYGVSTSAVLSEVSLGEKIEPNNCALKIYIVKNNETLWDVAKQLGTSVDEIIAQNPELELPLKEGDRVYIYYQKVMEF